MGAITLGLGLWLALAEPAQAHLDPGTGSYLLQVLLAVGLGAAATLRRFWRQLFHRVFRLIPSRRQDRHEQRKASD